MRLSLDSLDVASFATSAVESIDVSDSFDCTTQPTPMTWCRICPPYDTSIDTNG